MNYWKEKAFGEYSKVIKLKTYRITPKISSDDFFFIEFERPKKAAQTVEKRLVEGLVERLAESQRKIIELIRQDPSISKKALSGKIGISSTAIDKNIDQLKKKGLLKRVGPDKGGHWELME
jgi:ATP-dependent DNA helicase RecG